MKLLNLTPAIIFVASLLFTSCQKDIEADSSRNHQIQKAESIAALKPSAQLSAALKAKLAKLPANYLQRQQKIASSTLKLDPQYQGMALKAMNMIEATPCDGNTVLYQWLDKQLADWDYETLSWAGFTGMLSFPSNDALFFQNSSANQYFGVKGEYTHTIEKAFKDLKRFWNIQSNDIVLAAIHGNMLLDREKLIVNDMLLFGDSRERAEYWADLILSFLKEVPQYKGGNHPIFTFNAYALPSFYDAQYGEVPNKIVIGDGILDGYRAVGFDDVAPQAIVAHEFGHHIQFQLGYANDEYTPEASRKAELMADAYAAYFLSHSRGASMQWKRVQKFLQVFFNIGDCGFDNWQHHGTPTQRMAAAEWGYKVADNAQKQGHIMTAQQFTKLFEAALPKIVQK